MLTNTSELEAFCTRCAAYPYVTVDTEFLRERTYYSQLCLVQLAHPGEGKETAQLIDPLADGLDLTPFYDLMRNRDVIKVFHAARQDLEIFYVEGEVIPRPFFDTQVAAMVCGFGDQVGYETLVRSIAKTSLDKSSRFTDWSKRPLSDKQQAYALADVTHLRQIYEFLDAKLAETGRRSWVEEELAVLTNPDTYRVDPDEAWRRIKTRNANGPALAVVKELAKYREVTARTRNVPRNRVLKDDAILELAGTKPKSHKELSNSRLLMRESRREPVSSEVLAAISRAAAYTKADYPRPAAPPQKRQGRQGISELLRVLLKAKSEKAGVAQKLIASSADLDRLAGEAEPDIPCMSGWRREVFGEDALRLKRGEVALSADGDGVVLVPVSGS